MPFVHSKPTSVPACTSHDPVHYKPHDAGDKIQPCLPTVLTLKLLNYFTLSDFIALCIDPNILIFLQTHTQKRELFDDECNVLTVCVVFNNYYVFNNFHLLWLMLVVRQQY